MIKVSISNLFSFYLLFIIAILGVFWFFQDFLKRRKERKLRKNFIFCEICGETYINKSSDPFTNCPSCKSLNERKLMREL